MEHKLHTIESRFFRTKHSTEAFIEIRSAEIGWSISFALLDMRCLGSSIIRKSITIGRLEESDQIKVICYARRSDFHERVPAKILVTMDRNTFQRAYVGAACQSRSLIPCPVPARIRDGDQIRPLDHFMPVPAVSAARNQLPSPFLQMSTADRSLAWYQQSCQKRAS